METGKIAKQIKGNAKAGGTQSSRKGELTGAITSILLQPLKKTKKQKRKKKNKEVMSKNFFLSLASWTSKYQVM